MKQHRHPVRGAAALAAALSLAVSAAAQEKAPPPQFPYWSVTTTSSPTGPTPGLDGEVRVAPDNLILNPDFELTTATGCELNLTNAEFNAMMPNVIAFGSADELDIMAGGMNCGVDNPAQSGDVKIGLHRQEEDGDVDAFALALSPGIASGKTYALTFFAQASALPSCFDSVEIGVSNDPQDFGVSVACLTPLTTQWTQLSAVFVAPQNAAYLTVRQGDLESYNSVDNFSLCELICGSTAAAVSREAVSNPNSYTATAPVIAGTFSAVVDLGTTGHNLALILGYATPLTLVLGDGQTVLVNIADPGGEVLALPLLPGPIVSVNTPVPADCRVCGFMLSTQAVHVGGVLPFALSNAMDLTVGF